MHRPSHRLLRWLRLVMACLALALSGTPAHALPRAEAPVAAAVLAGRPAAQAPHPVLCPGPERLAPAAPPAHPGPVAGPGAPAPARRLFLVHRALLR
ncbi:MAG TPA: hypothetical protein VE153_30500 [Myxococcus sp.]|nr:hypothetical protein [Myxococcus sp.]